VAADVLARTRSGGKKIALKVALAEVAESRHRSAPPEKGKERVRKAYEQKIGGLLEAVAATSEARWFTPTLDGDEPLDDEDDGET
jgi:hypothetical protein